MVKDISELDLTKRYSYADYLTWRFKERVELIRGCIFEMSPAPNLKHQRISGDIFYEFKTFVRKTKCQVFHAPFDVRLPISAVKGKVDTVVQPDITVVCNESILDVQGCNGSPDLVVEILSPGNTKREMKDKFELYLAAKIPEYWLIDPERETIIIYSLDNSMEYIGSRPYMEGDIIKSKTLKGFELAVKDIF